MIQKVNKNYSFSEEYFDEVCKNLLLDELKFCQKINYNYMISSINYLIPMWTPYC